MKKFDIGKYDKMDNEGAMTEAGLALTMERDDINEMGLPLQMINGQMLIPHVRDPHPNIDYKATYSASSKAVYAHPRMTVSCLEWIQGLEKDNEIEDLIWLTGEELAEINPAKNSLVHAKFYAHNVMLNARIATLSAWEDLDAWNSWVYDVYKLGYDLREIAAVLNISMLKIHSVFTDASAIAMAKQARSEGLVDAMHSVQMSVLQSGMHKTKEGRSELRSKIAALVGSAGWAAIVTRANLVAFQPTHKIAHVELIPEVIINTKRNIE